MLNVSGDQLRGEELCWNKIRKPGAITSSVAAFTVAAWVTGCRQRAPGKVQRELWRSNTKDEAEGGTSASRTKR
jgi:hypothetical protein